MKRRDASVKRRNKKQLQQLSNNCKRRSRDRPNLESKRLKREGDKKMIRDARRKRKLRKRDRKQRRSDLE